MSVCFRKIATMVTSLLFLLASGATAHDKPANQKPRETSGTKKDLEKRLKAVEKAALVNTAEDAAKAMNAARHFEQVAISPDGNRVAWTEALTANDGASAGKTAIYVKNLQIKTAPLHITADSAGGSHAEGGLAWSPDSKHLAFLSDALKKDQLQLYVATIGATAPTKLTDVKGFQQTPSDFSRRHLYLRIRLVTRRLALCPYRRAGQRRQQLVHRRALRARRSQRPDEIHLQALIANRAARVVS